MRARCDYEGAGVCRRCSGDSFSSGDGHRDDDPTHVLDYRLGMVPNPKYKSPVVPPALNMSED